MNDNDDDDETGENFKSEKIIRTSKEEREEKAGDQPEKIANHESNSR